MWSYSTFHSSGGPTTQMSYFLLVKSWENVYLHSSGSCRGSPSWLWAPRSDIAVLVWHCRGSLSIFKQRQWAHTENFLTDQEQVFWHLAGVLLPASLLCCVSRAQILAFLPSLCGFASSERLCLLPLQLHEQCGALQNLLRDFCERNCYGAQGAVWCGYVINSILQGEIWGFSRSSYLLRSGWGPVSSFLGLSYLLLSSWWRGKLWGTQQMVVRNGVWGSVGRKCSGECAQIPLWYSPKHGDPPRSRTTPHISASVPFSNLLLCSLYWNGLIDFN